MPEAVYINFTASQHVTAPPPMSHTSSTVHAQQGSFLYIIQCLWTVQRGVTVGERRGEAFPVL